MLPSCLFYFQYLILDQNFYPALLSGYDVTEADIVKYIHPIWYRVLGFISARLSYYWSFQFVKYSRIFENIWESNQDIIH